MESQSPSGYEKDSSQVAYNWEVISRWEKIPIMTTCTVATSTKKLRNK